jgi:hypothetical protein
MEAAAFAAGEDLRRDVERVESRVAVLRRAEPEIDARQRNAIGHRLAAFLTEDRWER